MTTFDAPRLRALGYADVTRIRDDLLRMIGEAREAAEVLSDDGRIAELEQFATRLRSDQLCMILEGNFSVGKTCVVNALLGHKVLPSWATPTTAIINEVRWGPEPRAFVFHRDADDVPIPVELDELPAYVAVDEDNEEQESPYARAVVEWPLDLLGDGVTIIDSPGLNAMQAHDVIATQAVQRADALLFVFDCTSALGLNERLFLQRHVVAAGGARDVFFVGNKINFVDDPEDRARVERKVLRVLGELIDGQPQVFFVDARRALQGRLRGEECEVEMSGVAALEDRLERYLADEPGRRRLAGAARLVQVTTQDLRRLADTRINLVAQDREDLRRRYDAQAEPLVTLERRRDLILFQIANHNLETQRLAAAEATAMLRSVSENLVGWARDFEPETRVTLNPIKIKGKVEGRVGEMVQHLDQRVQVDFARWQTQTLGPLVESRLSALEGQIGGSVDAFVSQLYEIRVDLKLEPTGVVDAQGAEAGGRERILAAAAGLLVTGAGGAVEGGVFGFKGLIRSILPSVAAAVGLTLLHFGPWAIFTALFALGALRNILKLNAVNQKLKTDVAEKVAESVQSDALEHGTKLGAVVGDRLREVQDAIEASLENQITDLRREVQMALERHTLDEQERSREESQLRRVVGELDDVSRRAGDLFHELAR